MGLDNEMPLDYNARNTSFPSLGQLLEGVSSNANGRPKSVRESLRPASPFAMSPLDDSGSSSSSLVQASPMTKRQHALHEILASERAYASDLALIREVYMPLAAGKTPFSFLHKCLV